MPVEVDAGDGGGEVGRVGERRGGIAEIGPGDHGGGGDRRVQSHVLGDPHEAEADRADRRPRAADAGRHRGADHERRHVEVIRAEQLQPVIDHRHEGAAQGPCADQCAYGEEDEDGADTGAHAGDGGVAQRGERVAAAPREEHGDHGGDDEPDLVGSGRARVAEQIIGQGDQHDEAGDRDDRFDKREWLRLIRSGHVPASLSRPRPRGCTRNAGETSGKLCTSPHPTAPVSQAHY
jgi:hypothetical protein